MILLGIAPSAPTSENNKHLMNLTTLPKRPCYRAGLARDASSNYLLSNNLSTYQERRIVNVLRMSRIFVNPRKLEKSKKECYQLENEFSTFSTLYVSSNEFSTCQFLVTEWYVLFSIFAEFHR